MTLKEIKKLSLQEEHFFRENASVFLFPEWLKLFDNQSVILVGIVDKSGSIQGGFCYFKGKKLGKSIVGTPQFFAHNGLFYKNPAKTQANRNTFDKKVMKAIEKYLSEQKTLFISLGFPSHIKDVQPFIWRGFNVSLKYTYQLDLKNNPEQLLAEFSPERRKNITKAEKDQIEVKKSENPTLVAELVVQSIQRKEAPVDQVLLKKIIFELLGTELAYAFVAYQNQQPAATVFIVHDKHCAYYLFGGFDASNKHQGAGALCMWHAIQYAQTLGINTFDFEGSMLPEVEKYFRGFGGELKPLINVHSASYFMQIALKSKGKKGF